MGLQIAGSRETMAGIQEWSHSGSVRGAQVFHVENTAQARARSEQVLWLHEKVHNGR